MPTANQQSAFLSYVAEATAGETPADPSMNKLRTTDPLAITPERGQLESEQPYSHRQATMARGGAKGVGGNIPFELSYAAFDDWLEAVLGGSWSDETAGTPEVLKIGNNINTFTVERGFSDISQYEVFRGVIPNSLSLEMTPDLVTGQFGVIGMGWDAPSNTSLGAPSDVATNEPFDGLGNATLSEGGSTSAIITAINMEINNNRNARPVMGSNDRDVPHNGQIQVTGTLTARFQDLALLQKFYNETASSLQVILNDQGGSDSLTIDFHNIKYNGGGREADNMDLDVSLPFIALYDAGNTSGITVTRSNAA